MAQSRISGILPVYKPEGWTSFDIVAKVRNITGIRKTGHGGTLDPMASGVLPVFLGKAARACDIMPDDRKRYVAAFRFGETTDTLDATGTVTALSDIKVTRQLVSMTCKERLLVVNVSTVLLYNLNLTVCKVCLTNNLLL